MNRSNSSCCITTEVDCVDGSPQPSKIDGEEGSICMNVVEDICSITEVDCEDGNYQFASPQPSKIGGKESICMNVVEDICTTEVDCEDGNYQFASPQPSKIGGDEMKKTMFMMYKFDSGPILYSLHAFSVERAISGKKPNTKPLTLIQMQRADYALGMGFALMESSNTLYMIGGQFYKNGTTFSSKKAFYIDLNPLMAASCPNSPLLLSVKDAPNMNAGKINPMVFAANGKLYVMSTHMNQPFEICTRNKVCSANSFDDEFKDGTPVMDDDEAEIKFEVFDPQSGTWTVLPNPPGYEHTSYHLQIWGHAFVRHKLYLLSPFYIYCFDSKKLSWELFPRCSFPEPTDGVSALAHAIHRSMFVGRAEIVDGQHEIPALFTFNTAGNALLACRIPTGNADTSLSFCVVKDLEIEFTHRCDPSGCSIARGAELIHLGHGIFGLVSRVCDFVVGPTNRERRIHDRERHKRDISIKIFQVISEKTSGSREETNWRAKTLNKYFLEEIDDMLGTFVYCFALDGRILNFSLWSKVAFVWQSALKKIQERGAFGAILIAIGGVGVCMATYSHQRNLLK